MTCLCGLWTFIIMGALSIGKDWLYLYYILKTKEMIRKKELREDRRLVIDLTGPDGNAFVLIGMARGFARQLGDNPDPIIEEMMSGDYENLLQVFDRHFGDLIILER
jgi:hypothetical protein